MTWGNTLYLKFDSRESFLSAMETAQLATENPEYFGAANIAVDVVGIIYRDDTPEGQPPVARPGYHVNIRLNDTPLHEALEPFLISTPVNPSRIFA